MAKPSPLLLALAAFRKQLDQQESKVLAGLVADYRRLYDRLQDKIDLLVAQIGDEQPTLGQLTRLTRYRSLMEQTERELIAYGVQVQNAVETAINAGLTIGPAHANQLLSTAITGDFQLAARFNRLPKSALETMIGYLSPDSPLTKRIERLAPTTAATVIDTLKEAIGLGYNPRKTATMIRNAYGQGLTDALRLTRTAQLWSYREAQRYTWQANPEITSDWIWHANLDSYTCMSCVVMHGTVHPYTETLDDHHNGRCSMIPLVRGFDPVVQDGAGKQWFERLPEAKQARQMGPKYFEAWKGGKFELDQLPTERENDVYGLMRGVTPLKNLVGANSDD